MFLSVITRKTAKNLRLAFTIGSGLNLTYFKAIIFHFHKKYIINKISFCWSFSDIDG